ncbi:hypothetical protein ES703_92383 [subsurface metagenome]
MVTKSAEQYDTSWAAIDSMETPIRNIEVLDLRVGEIGLDSDEEEQTFTKTDFERDLRKASRKIKK